MCNCTHNSCFVLTKSLEIMFGVHAWVSWSYMSSFLLSVSVLGPGRSRTLGLEISSTGILPVVCISTDSAPESLESLQSSPIPHRFYDKSRCPKYKSRHSKYKSRQQDISADTQNTSPDIKIQVQTRKIQVQTPTIQVQTFKIQVRHRKYKSSAQTTSPDIQDTSLGTQNTYKSK